MTLNDYFHSIPVQLRFKDIDKQGHVNNANHFTYFETGRIHYFGDVIGRNVDWDATGLLLARIEMDYREPVFLQDEVFVFTKVSKLGTKSFDMISILAKKVNNEFRTCAEGKSVIVCYDYHAKKTIEIPSEWRTKFSSFEKIS